jgi:hypothetical protein
MMIHFVGCKRAISLDARAKGWCIAAGRGCCKTLAVKILDSPRTSTSLLESPLARGLLPPRAHNARPIHCSGRSTQARAVGENGLIAGCQRLSPLFLPHC